MDVSPWICAAVFAGYLVVDWLAARYTLAITERQPARAATTGAVMYLFMAGGVIAYTTKPLYVLPAAFGSWLGTYLAIRPRRAHDGDDAAEHAQPTGGQQPAPTNPEPDG